MTYPDVADRSSRYRVEPTPLVGVAVVVVYIVVVFGTQLSSGIPYEDWVSTPANAVRAAIIPLAGGSALLVAFLAFARWDMIWRDPDRLPMPMVMKVAIYVFIASILVRFLGVDWGTVEADLLLVVVGSGVLVGFAEETLFRGIFLRSMRTRGRTEAVAALWTRSRSGSSTCRTCSSASGWASSPRSCLRQRLVPPCTRSGAIGASF
jgi:uncharacterized protein